MVNSLLHRFSQWMIRHKRGRIISRDDDGDGYPEIPYLIRVVLFRCKWFGLFLHCFLTSDTEGVHDHPWSNITFLILGQYNEEFVDGSVKIRKPFSFVYRQAELFHRITLDKEFNICNTWSLFFVGKRRRKWGFLPVNNEWKEFENVQD